MLREIPSPRPQLLALAQLFLASSTVLSVSLVSWVSLLMSLPSSQLGCLSQYGPSTECWSISQPWAAQLCPVCHRTAWRQKEPQLDLKEDQQPVFQLLRKYGFSEDNEDLFEGLGAFCLVGFFFVFPNFLLLLFASSDTHSRLHKPLVGSLSHHWEILMSHLEPMFSIFFETCHVRPARSTSEATLGGKKSPSC